MERFSDTIDEKIKIQDSQRSGGRYGIRYKTNLNYYFRVKRPRPRKSGIENSAWTGHGQNRRPLGPGAHFKTRPNRARRYYYSFNNRSGCAAPFVRTNSTIVRVCRTGVSIFNRHSGFDDCATITISDFKQNVKAIILRVREISILTNGLWKNATLRIIIGETNFFACVCKTHDEISHLY